MIKNYQDYLFYLRADQLSSERPSANIFSKAGFARIAFPDCVWEFHVALRKLEYLRNVAQTPLVRLRRALVYRKYLYLSDMLGFTIPINVFGPGLSIAHHGTIVVNKGARVGANCRIHTCVNIGTEAGKEHEAPRIGNNTYIGPGAKIFGPIQIADGCAIGANAVVNKSFLEPGSVIAGVPARRIGEIDTGTILRKGTEMLLEISNARASVSGN